MTAIRHLLAQRRLATLLCAAALLLKLLVPTGYMLAADHGRPVITLCGGTMPAAATPMAAMPGMHAVGADHGVPRDHAKPELPCAFAGLSAAALGAVDPVQLAVLIAFVLAVALARLAPPPPVRRVPLRPPLRGPPAFR